MLVNLAGQSPRSVQDRIYEIVKPLIIKETPESIKMGVEKLRQKLSKADEIGFTPLDIK